ncbi:glycosyltransferase [Enterococcus faecium]|uniref:glycosyltransferase n=1 Tax=Enterococcus faecium TaxID=1352 RepID=UPI000BF1D555|nr:glycosyltransferase [Enterococcus faecium]PEH49526.1 hypothetical protein CRM75_01865 [Enterococcus faecium]
MKYSVVVTTYNGEKFIIGQLKSIMNQSIPPTEVIIIDDKSKDNTCLLIEEFILIHKLDSWKLYVNANNLGWKKNFIYAIEKATNDVIFLADQDDIWYTEKAKIFTHYFKSNPSINVISSAFDKIDEYGECINDLKSNFSKNFLFPKFSYKNFRVRYPGCTYAFRSSFFHKIKPFWSEEMPHDALLWWYGNLTETLAIYTDPLISYRRHSNNVSGNKLTRNEIITKIKSENVFLNNLNSSISILEKEFPHDNYEENQKVINDLMRYTLLRIRGYSTNSLYSICKNFILYNPCYASYASPTHHPILSEIKNFLLTK